MFKYIKSILFLVLLVGQVTQAQEEEEKEGEGLGTETVTVTKAYTPTISDAFKIKSLPDLNDSIVLKKKPVEYNIFSVPVASTFTPAKGKASTVEKTPPPVLFNSYASVAAGYPGNAMADFYTSREIDREKRLDIGLTHNSIFSDFDDVYFSNAFADSKVTAALTTKERDFDWTADMAFQHQIYHWYGTPEGALDLVEAGDEAARQRYLMGEVGGKFNLADSFFKNASVRYRRFWDGHKSGENRVIFTPSFDFPITDEELSLDANVDWVQGGFENASVTSVTNDAGIKYNNLQVGLKPNLKILRDDLTLELGVNVVYGMDLEASEGSFYVFPDIRASYRLLDDVAIAYGGIVGELRQNSYYDFTEENPYVSPTLEIAPTDQQYDAFAGLKGQLLPNLSYNVKASYKAENKLPLFLLNPQNDLRTDGAYLFSNTYQVFYDDVKTISFFGELNVDFNRNFSLGLNATYFNYTTETDNPAWNLPNLTASLFLDYQIGEEWFMGANLFYVGEREDLSSIVERGVAVQDFASTAITLDGYFDANMHVGYRLNKQLSVFAKAANLANNNYQKWANYQVQGLQVLAGATYKFDF